MLSLKVRISFISLFVLVVIFSILCFKDALLPMQYIVLGVSIIPITLINRSDDDTNWAKISIKNLVAERHKAMQILNELGIKEKNQVKQLHSHLLNKFNAHKEHMEKTQKRITITYQIVGVPFLLAVAKYVIENDSYSFNDKMKYCIVAFAIALIIYLSILGFVKVIFLTDHKRYNNLRDFVLLLQEILDYEFEITDNDINV